ncbi:MAG: hypothetical protein IJX63_04675 [Lachnospiraceae bacterium]|nr:hypothetical protein [Lachnospiraceae bacterium]
MSWDIYLVRTETNTEPEHLIPEENMVKFTREEIIRELVVLARDLNLKAEDLEAKYVHLRGGDWSIEFNFWDDLEPYSTIDMEVRGGKLPTEVLSRLKKDLKARIVDMCAGEFWEEEGASGFSEWKALNDKVARGLKGI